MLLKVLLPGVSIWVEVLVKVTVLVPVPAVKVPLTVDQFPETLKAPEGAIKVPVPPAGNVTVDVFTFPDEPVNVPAETVNPPLNACVPAPAW